VAPFSAISGATISNLVVDGRVRGVMHCAGLVGAVVGGSNTIADCEVAVAITSSGGSYFGGIVGHGLSAETTLRGCVFSGTLTGGGHIATLFGWGDSPTVTIVDCLDASSSAHPIGRGGGTVSIANTLFLAQKNYHGNALWDADHRGRQGYAVTAGERVELGFGEPLRTYGASKLAVHTAGLVHGGSLHAEAGASIALRPVFIGSPPGGTKHDGFRASAGDLAKNGDAWELTMPDANVIVSAAFVDLPDYDAWAAANGVSGAWNETDALGVHNVFRYAFDNPAGAFDDPPLLDIAIEGDRVVVKTPPVSNTVGFAVLVVESSDVAGATATATRPLDATGRTEFAQGAAPSRFYRLAASEAGGVQLWENGPYWAECNVGAEKPEDYGYYFWWGDTVGYTITASGWSSVKDGTIISFTSVGTATATYRKDNSALLSEGYIDETGNLAAAHDAATAHLGAPWRMPTNAEFIELHDNCNTEWTTRNGVYGALVTGKGYYADRSIFLPAAGCGYYEGLDNADPNGNNADSYGFYWSSTPDSDNSSYAWRLHFYWLTFRQDYIYRYLGESVRPVRDAD
jgi:hypothetical protein